MTKAAPHSSTITKNVLRSCLLPTTISNSPVSLLRMQCYIFLPTAGRASRRRPGGLPQSGPGPGGRCRTPGPFQKSPERTDYIQRQREHDGRVFFRTDLHEGLEVPQLQRDGLLLDDV